MNIEQLQNLPDAEKAKLFAARHALTFVKPNTRIGLGTGSTAVWFVKLLAQAQVNGLKFRACATSSQTTKLAESLGIKIESLDDFTPPDSPFPLQLVIDGTDEFDSGNDLIKGGGGALLQEKITEYSAEYFIVIADKSKEVKTLGKFPLPVEVVRFAWQTTAGCIKRVLSASSDVGDNKIMLRMAGDKPFITDEGHYILDLHLKFIKNPDYLDNTLKRIAGVVETGLFFGFADEVIMADSSGLVKSRETGEKKWMKTQYDLAGLADMLLQD